MYQKILKGEPFFSDSSTNYTELQLLSARLRIISTCTMLCPKDFYLLNEEALEQNPEWSVPENINSKDSWTHRLPGILQFGCMFYKEHFFFQEYEYTLEQKEEIDDHLNTNFPEMPILRELSEMQDVQFYGKTKRRLWQLRLFGEEEEFEAEEGSQGDRVLVLKNNEWIGAINYFGMSSENFGFFYRGYGFKEGFGNIEQNIQGLRLDEKEQMFLPEYPEPNPQNEESEKLETDSEDEDYSI